MKNNYLSKVLADLIEDEYLELAMRLDAHLREIWRTEASDDFKKVLECFESKPGDNTAAELTVYLLLTEAMLDDGRKEATT